VKYKKFERRKVRIKTDDGRVFEGFIIPKTEFSSEDIVVLKLRSGYNIGISEKRIKEIEDLGEEAEVGRVILREKIEGKGPRVTMIGTGGTIASRVDYLTGGVKASMSVEEILSFVPEVEKFADLKFINLMQKLSEDMVPENWKQIAEEVGKHIKGSNGIVILHGTDTMHYTSSILSFMIDALKPIILTGAQRSSDRPSTDAFINILASVHAALSDIGEVAICFHASMSDECNYVIRGNRARKMHTSSRPAFKSINYPPLARIWPDGRFEKIAEYYSRNNEYEPKIDTKIEEKVALVKVYPGADPEILRWFAERGYRGIIIEGTGLGHVPVAPDNGKSWIPVIEELSEEVFVGIVSQTIFGRTHRYVYTNLRKLHRAGAVHLEDMTAETAYTKAMWVLGHVQDLEEAKKLMLKNLKGEISKRTLNV